MSNPIAGCAIVSVTNCQDAMHADVVLTGTIVGGTPTFYVASVPEAVPVLAPSFLLPTGVYRVVMATPGLWYVWVQDSQGRSANPSAVWVGLSDILDVNLTGMALAEILTRHKAGLEAQARETFFPKCTIKFIGYGTARNITDYPAILVTKPRFNSQWVAAPMVRQITYRFDILIFVLHNSPDNWLSVATNLANAVNHILDLPEYDALRLSSGTPLAFCQSSEGDSDDIEVEEGIYCALGSCTWSGEALEQRGDAQSVTPLPF